MKKLMSKLISRFIYSQPLICMVTLMGGIIALVLSVTILPQSVETPLLLLVIAAFMICLVLTRKGKYQYFTVVPDVFIRKRYCINQREILKKGKTCPREKFLTELEDVLETMPSGVTYHATTHERVIRKIKKFSCVINGKVELTQFPYSYRGNLSSIEKKLWCDCCITCENEKCRIRKAHINKQPNEKVKFYAIELRRTK